MMNLRTHCQINKKSGLRRLILFYFDRGRKRVRLLRICAVYGEEVVANRTVRNWFARFKSGHFNLNDALRSGIPILMNEDQLRDLLKENGYQTCRELDEKIKCDFSRFSPHFSRWDSLNSLELESHMYLPKKQKHKMLFIVAYGQWPTESMATTLFLCRIIPGDKRSDEQKNLCLYRRPGFRGFGFTLRHFIKYPESPDECSQLSAEDGIGNTGGIESLSSVDTIFVYDVKAGSPAHIGGLQKGDRIIVVNGRSILNEAYRQVVDLIKKSESCLSLTVAPRSSDVLQVIFQDTVYHPETNLRVRSFPLYSSPTNQPQCLYKPGSRHPITQRIFLQDLQSLNSVDNPRSQDNLYYPLVSQHGLQRLVTLRGRDYPGSIDGRYLNENVMHAFLNNIDNSGDYPFLHNRHHHYSNPKISVNMYNDTKDDNATSVAYKPNLNGGKHHHPIPPPYPGNSVNWCHVELNPARKNVLLRPNLQLSRGKSAEDSLRSPSGQRCFDKSGSDRQGVPTFRSESLDDPSRVSSKSEKSLQSFPKPSSKSGAITATIQGRNEVPLSSTSSFTSEPQCDPLYEERVKQSVQTKEIFLKRSELPFLSFIAHPTPQKNYKEYHATPEKLCFEWPPTPSVAASGIAATSRNAKMVDEYQGSNCLSFTEYRVEETNESKSHQSLPPEIDLSMYNSSGRPIGSNRTIIVGHTRPHCEPPQHWNSGSELHDSLNCRDNHLVNQTEKPRSSESSSVIAKDKNAAEISRNRSYKAASEDPIQIKKDSSPSWPVSKSNGGKSPLIRTSTTSGVEGINGVRRRSVVKLSTEFFGRRGHIMKLKQFFEDRDLSHQKYSRSPSIHSAASKLYKLGGESQGTDEVQIIEGSKVILTSQVTFRFIPSKKAGTHVSRTWKVWMWAHLQQNGTVFISKEKKAEQITNKINLKEHLIEMNDASKKLIFTQKVSDLDGVHQSESSVVSGTGKVYHVKFSSSAEYEKWKEFLKAQSQDGVDASTAPSRTSEQLCLPSPPSTDLSSLATSPKSKTWKTKVAKQWKKVQSKGLDASASFSDTNSSVTSSSSLNLTLPPFDVDLTEFPSGVFNPYVPRFLEYAMNLIESKGMEVVGLYRIPGNNSAVAALSEKLNKKEVPSPDDDARWLDVNVVASLLKSFFRRIPEPILTSEYYQMFIQAANERDDEKGKAQLKEMLDKLPNHNYETLRVVAKHLKRVAEGEKNKMDARNLAIVFGPTVVRTAEDNLTSMMVDMKNQCRIIEMLILYADELFTARHMTPVANPAPMLGKKRETLAVSLHEAAHKILNSMEKETKEPPRKEPLARFYIYKDCQQKSRVGSVPSNSLLMDVTDESLLSYCSTKTGFQPLMNKEKVNKELQKAKEEFEADDPLDLIADNPSAIVDLRDRLPSCNVDPRYPYSSSPVASQANSINYLPFSPSVPTPIQARFHIPNAVPAPFNKSYLRTNEPLLPSITVVEQPSSPGMMKCCSSVGTFNAADYEASTVKSEPVKSTLSPKHSPAATQNRYASLDSINVIGSSNHNFCLKSQKSVDRDDMVASLSQEFDKMLMVWSSRESSNIDNYGSMNSNKDQQPKSVNESKSKVKELIDEDGWGTTEGSNMSRIDRPEPEGGDAESFERMYDMNDSEGWLKCKGNTLDEWIQHNDSNCDQKGDKAKEGHKSAGCKRTYSMMEKKELNSYFEKHKEDPEGFPNRSRKALVRGSNGKSGNISCGKKSKKTLRRHSLHGFSDLKTIIFMYRPYFKADEKKGSNSIHMKESEHPVNGKSLCKNNNNRNNNNNHNHNNKNVPVESITSGYNSGSGRFSPFRESHLKGNVC